MNAPINPRNQINDAWLPNLFVETSFDIDEIFSEEMRCLPRVKSKILSSERIYFRYIRASFTGIIITYSAIKII